MWPAGNQIESAVVFFYAFDFPTSGALISNHGINSDALDFIVADQSRYIRVARSGCGNTQAVPCR